MTAAELEVAWGKMPAGEALDQVLGRARALVGGFLELPGDFDAGTGAELTFEVEAVRRVAYYLHRTGDQAGARVLAQANDHLLADVNVLLRRWRDHGRTDRTSVGIGDLRRALVKSPPIRTDLLGRAHDIAEYLAFGAITRVRGGGSGVEAEFPYLLTFTGEHDLDGILAEQAVLAYGPDRMFSVTVDENAVFRGGNRRYYRTEGAARRAGGGRPIAVKFGMPEFVSDVTRTFPGESGYHDHGQVFTALSRLEQILEGLRGEAGSGPEIWLSDVLRREDGFYLTDLGQRTAIGPRPEGDRPGANVQYTFGVPLTGLYSFLKHVLEHTRRDEKGYLRRAHLADGLEFGSQIAFRFMMEKYFPDGKLPPGVSAEDELARRGASEPAVAQLRGYAALLYTGAATTAHSLIYDGNIKDNAAVLARHDMRQILAALPAQVRDYLRRNADDIMGRFEQPFRNRIPRYDDRFREKWFGGDESGSSDEDEGGGPATIDLLRPPVDWARDNRSGVPRSPAHYLLDGLDPARAPHIPQKRYMGMNTLPGLDTRHQQELGFSLAALEVRAYGARPVSAEVARAQHERLAEVVRELGARDQGIAQAASARRAIRESLARHPRTLRLRSAVPQNVWHAGPGVIWQAAIDFLRAEPAVASQIRFVEDAWRDDGQPWTLIPLPAGIRQLLGVGGPTVMRDGHTVGRHTHVTPGQIPEPVAVTFPEGRSAEDDIPDSLRLPALARWLAEAGAAHDASTPHGGQLPQVQITGFGNGRRLDPTDGSARRTGQDRADAVRARLLSSVRHYLRQLGADPAIADSVLPAGQATGAPRPKRATRAAGRQAVATVRPGIQANDHLLAEVNLLLRRWRREGRTDHPAAGLEDVRRALVESPPIRSDLRGRAHDIAEYLAFGAITRVRAGGSGIEAELPYILTFSDEHDLDGLLAERAELAYGPGRMFAVTVDENVCFLGGDGRYYRRRADAESAADGTASAVTFAMPEFVSNVTRTFPEESGYADHEPVFMALSRLEQILADLPGEAGSLPGIPLSQVLRPEDGFELTEPGSRAFIGPRPVGEKPGAEVQHTFGVPLTGLYVFLEHVLDHTRRDEKDYLTRAHLADALEFGSRIAFRFMLEKYFPDGDLPPGSSALDELTWRSASEPAVAQLRGYAALLYTGAATVAHSFTYKGLNKDNAAVLSRHDMGQILAALQPEVRDYLGWNADDIMSRFEQSFRSRIPGYDDQFRERWLDQEEGGGPATINLLRPPMDWARAHEFGLPISPANYLLGGLDPARAPEIPQYLYMGMSTLPGLDANHQEELGSELVVLEVRAYGAWHVSAEDAQAQHERLAAVVRELGARDQRIALAASARQVIRESLEEHTGILNLRLAGPVVTGHARPGAIWQAALDFLRAEPAVTSQIRFVEDAWRDIGQPWKLIPLPAGIRQLLGVGGPTVIAGSHSAGRRTHASVDEGPEPVAVTFPEGRSGEEDIPDSLELTALARWLAEAGAAQDGELPQVRITGFGNESSLDPADESARRTGQRRADAVRARLLSSVRGYLRQLGADPAIAGSLLPADQATGASGQDLATSETAGQAVATVHARPPDIVTRTPDTELDDSAERTPSGLYLRAAGAGGIFGGPRDRVAANAFPEVAGALVVHVHAHPASGLLAVGGRLLTPEDFHAEVVPLLGLAPGQLLVLVACRAGSALPGAQAAAGALADLAQRPVLAASGDVFTTPAGMVEVRQAGVDPAGRMTLQGASWRLFRPGQPEPAEFGPDLEQVLREQALADDLLAAGLPPLQVSLRAVGTELPAEDVRWLAPGSLEQAWTAGHQRFTEMAVRLAGQATPGQLAGDAPAVSGALARYARARLDRAAAVEALADFRGRPDGSSSPLADEFGLVAAVRGAQRELTGAQDELTELGVSYRQAGRKLARLLARPVGGGLPGAGPGRRGGARKDGAQGEGTSNEGTLAWQGAVLDLATGELSYEGTTVTLRGDRPALMAELIRADGQPRTSRQLADATPYTQRSVTGAVGVLRNELSDLPDFPGEIGSRPGGGFWLGRRAAALPAVPDGGGQLAWAGAVLDPVSGQLSYGGRTVTLSEVPAAVLAVLIRADGQPRTATQLTGAIPGQRSPIAGAVRDVREALEGLPGFRGEIVLRSVGYRLVQNTPALPAGLDVAVPVVWPGVVLDLASGQLRVADSTVTLPPDQAAVLAALIRAGGQSVTPARLITGPAQTQNDVRAATEILSATLARLPGFPGRVTTAGTGFLLVSAGTLTWNGLTLDVADGRLRYSDSTVILPPDQAAVLAALIRAGDQARTPEQILEGSSRTVSYLRNAVWGLRSSLEDLSEFRGGIESGPSGYLLVPDAAAAPTESANQAQLPGSAAALTWNGLSLDPASRELSYRDSTMELPPDQAAALAALIRAGGQPRTGAQLAEGTPYAPSTMRTAAANLREMLEGLPGFRGEITAPLGRTGGYMLASDSALRWVEPATGRMPAPVAFQPGAAAMDVDDDAGTGEDDQSWVRHLEGSQASAGEPLGQAHSRVTMPAGWSERAGQQPRGGAAVGDGAVRPVSEFAPQWAAPGAAGFFEVAPPARVRRHSDLRISEQAVVEQLERTAQPFFPTAWATRNIPGGGVAAASAAGVHEPGGVGFLVTVPVPYQPVGQAYNAEYRSPAELAEMFARAAGQRWRSGLRMVIALNRFNDPRRSQVRWVQPYGTTDQVERELAAAVSYWQQQVDAVAPGIVTVIGQMVEPSVWDHGRLVDADVVRHLMTKGRIKHWRRFPYAGARQAIVGSAEALARLRELWQFNDEVWIHLGDSDVVDTVNPAGGNAVSLLARFAAEIRRSGRRRTARARWCGWAADTRSAGRNWSTGLATGGRKMRRCASGTRPG